MKKKLALLSFLFMFCLSLNGQTHDASDSLCSGLSGTWQWVGSNRDSFTVNFRVKDTTYISYVGDLLRYEIYGWHRYTIDSLIVEDNLVYTGINYKMSTMVGLVKNGKEMFLTFTDSGINRSFRVNLDFINTDMTLLRWTSRPLEKLFYPQKWNKISEAQAIPKTLVLRKIGS